MRSILFLIAGLIAGFVLSRFMYSVSPKELPVDAAPKYTEDNTPQSASPFAVVETTVENATIATADVNNVVPAIIETSIEPAQANASISAIDHYTDLIAILNRIKTADSIQLLTFVQRLQQDDYTARRLDYFKAAITTAIYQRWAVVDIDAALKNIEQGLQPSNRGAPFAMEAASILASLRPESVQNWLDGLNNNQRSQIESQVYSGISSTDPEAFARSALAKSTKSRPDGMLLNAVMQWANNDPAAAWHFIQDEAGAEIADMISSPLMYAWLERDPQNALAELEVRMADPGRDDNDKMMFLDMYASALAQSDPAGALQWVTAQLEADQSDKSLTSQQSFQHSVLPNVLYNAAEMDPLAVEQWIDQLVGTQHESLIAVALPSITEVLANRDPLKAMELAERYPNEYTGDNREIILQQWLYTDPESATAWLATQPGTAANERLVISAAMSLMYEDPEKAVSLLGNLQTNITPDIALSIVGPLAETNADVARQWLSAQSDPKVLEAGSIYIDISQKSAGTAELLNRIQQIQSSGEMTMLVVSLLNHGTKQDREIVSQWLSSIDIFGAQERDQLESMIQSADYMEAPAGFYIRRNHFEFSGGSIDEGAIVIDR